MNSGLFSAGGDNWVYRWVPASKSSGADPGNWIYGMLYQTNSGDDYLWVGVGYNNGVFGYINMTTLEWSDLVQDANNTLDGIRGIYETSWFGNSGIAAIGQQASGSNRYALWNEGFMPSAQTTAPANYRSFYWTNQYPYATYFFKGNPCKMGNPGGSDDARYYGAYSGMGSYYSPHYVQFNMSTTSGATAMGGRSYYRTSYTGYPVGLETTGTNSSGRTYGWHGQGLGGTRYAEFVSMNNNGFGGQDTKALGDSNTQPFPCALTKVNHDSADYFYGQTTSYSTSSTYNYGHVIKFDTNNDIEWQRKVQPGSPNSSNTGGLGEVAPDHVNGGCYGIFDMQDTQTNSSTARWRTWIVKWDKDGTIQWSRALYRTDISTGTYTFNIQSADGTADGDLVIGMQGSKHSGGELVTWIVFLKGDGSGTGTFTIDGETWAYSDSLTLNESAGHLPTAGNPSASSSGPQVTYAQATAQAYVGTEIERHSF